MRKKINWNNSDDMLLLAIVKKIGTKSWIKICEVFNNGCIIHRDRKQIRQRYMYYLRSNKPSEYFNKKLTNNEIIKLLKLFKKYNTDWTKIGKLWNKDNNVIKINFYKYLRKFIKFICVRSLKKFCKLISI